jgi:hypothetical protein
MIFDEYFQISNSDCDLTYMFTYSPPTPPPNSLKNPSLSKGCKHEAPLGTTPSEAVRCEILSTTNTSLLGRLDNPLLSNV